MKIWRQKGLLINGALALVLIATGIVSYLVIKPASSSAAVQTTAVQQGTVLATVSASGTLEAAQNLGLNFTTGGKVTHIYVKVGQRVKAGQVLAKVDATASKNTLAQVQAQLAAAQAQLAAAEQGETSGAKTVAGDQAAQSAQQVQTAESNLSAAEISAADDAASAEQSVTTAQDNLGFAQQALSNDESKLSTDEAALGSAQAQLGSAEATECPPGADPTQSTPPACTPATTITADQAVVTSDQNTVTADQNTILSAQQTVTNDQNSVSSAQDSEKTTEDHDKATITADKLAVTSAQKSYKTTLATNVENATPNQTTIAQDEAAVTADNVTVATDEQAVAGATLTAPFSGTVASISSDVGSVVSSSGGGSSSASSSGSGSGSGSSSSSISEAAAGSGSGAGTGAGGAGTSNAASGFIVLTDLSNLLVQATFDETDVASMHTGAQATVSLEGVPSANALSATVAEIDPTSTTSSGVVDYGVTLALTQPDSSLKAGETVSVSVITGQANNALYVPATAVTTAGNVSTVVVVGANNVQRTTVVTLGVQGSTDDQILSGLTLGERVLTSTATPASGGGGGFGFRGVGGGFGGGLGGGGGRGGGG